MIQRLAQIGSHRDLPPCQRRSDRDPSARRLGFIAVQGIGRAYGQAKSALHTLVGQHGERQAGVLKRHVIHAIIRDSQPFVGLRDR